MSNIPPYSIKEMDEVRAKLRAKFGDEGAELIETLITMIIEDRAWIDPDDR